MEFRIDSSALTEAVAWASRVLPARSPVPVLGGLLLEAADGGLRISGRDYEASARIELAADTERDGRALALDAGSIGFESARTRTTTRLLDGRLPRHDMLFALGEHAVAETALAPLTEAVGRVAVVAEGDSPVQLRFTEDAVHLRAGCEDDVASQRLPAVLEGGAESLTVAVNPGYLLDALHSFASDSVRFRLLGPGQRALLTDASGTAHRHLLMSVRAPLL
ncbi:hypothetical protein ACE1OA_10145 [Streptomyces sp. JL2001]|uniref:hypothetical protein n=1 Tax=Streptomyces sp. JL2001 TaxID=3342488 RepID=UPI003D803766